VPGTFFPSPLICSQFLSTIYPETTVSLQLGHKRESYSPSQLTLSILCPLFLQSTDPAFIVLKYKKASREFPQVNLSVHSNERNDLLLYRHLKIGIEGMLIIDTHRQRLGLTQTIHLQQSNQECHRQGFHLYLGPRVQLISEGIQVFGAAWDSENTLSKWTLPEQQHECFLLEGQKHEKLEEYKSSIDMKIDPGVKRARFTFFSFWCMYDSSVHIIPKKTNKKGMSSESFINI